MVSGFSRLQQMFGVNGQMKERVINAKFFELHHVSSVPVSSMRGEGAWSGNCCTRCLSPIGAPS